MLVEEGGEMASIGRVWIDRVSDLPGRNEEVVAEVNVLWNEDDVGHEFRLTGYLIDQDGSLDSYSLRADGSLDQQRRGFGDDIIGSFGAQTLTPGGVGSEMVDLRGRWDFAGGAGPRRDYRVVATLVPTGVMGDVRVSLNTIRSRVR